MLCRSLAALLLLSAPAIAREHHLLMRIAVVGGCRLQRKDVKKQARTNPSSATYNQLVQTLHDLSQLTTPPRYTFFTGDIVNNLIADQGEVLSGQLNGWIQIVRHSTLWKKSEFVCMPGNHEVLEWIGEDGEVPNPPCYPIWQGFVKGHGLARHGGNGPKGGGADHLVGDQSSTTYSFTDNHVHFVVVNTDSLSTAMDPQTGHPYGSWIPIHWIERDFRRAEADPDVRTILMLGHKPLHQRSLGAEHTPIELPLSKRLEHLMLTTPKFRAYLTGHEHLWRANRIRARGPWQLIMGNAGTKPDEPWLSHGYFGFTLFNLYSDGDVGVVDCRRPIPKPYYGPATPAVRQPEWLLSAGPPRSTARKLGGGAKPPEPPAPRVQPTPTP
jgi:hypothetical protein